MMPPVIAIRGSLAGVLLFAPACERKCERLPPSQDADERTGEGEPPKIVANRFLTADVVELSFSEPLGPVDGVDPEKFRLGLVLSVAETYRGRCERYVYYCEIADEFNDYGCGYGYSSYYDEQERTRVTSLELDDEDASRLRLRIAPRLEPATCLRIDYAEHPAAMHVFFSALDSPSILDRDGEALADIAPHWPLLATDSTVHDDFVALRHWMPIPCPEQF